jgi:hypothetical protein
MCDPMTRLKSQGLEKIFLGWLGWCLPEMPISIEHAEVCSLPIYPLRAVNKFDTYARLPVSRNHLTKKNGLSLHLKINLRLKVETAKPCVHFHFPRIHRPTSIPLDLCLNRLKIIGHRIIAENII